MTTSTKHPMRVAVLSDMLNDMTINERLAATTRLTVPAPPLTCAQEVAKARHEAINEIRVIIANRKGSGK